MGLLSASIISGVVLIDGPILIIFEATSTSLSHQIMTRVGDQSLINRLLLLLLISVRRNWLRLVGAIAGSPATACP